MARRRSPAIEESSRESLQEFKAGIFKALAHPRRIKILELLRGRELTVTQVGAALDIDIASVSQHLAVLRNKGIIEGRKQGLTVCYRVKHDNLYQVLDLFREWFTRHVETQRRRLDALDAG